MIAAVIFVLLFGLCPGFGRFSLIFQQAILSWTVWVSIDLNERRRAS